MCVPSRSTFITGLLVLGPERKFNAEAVTTAYLFFMGGYVGLSFDCFHLEKLCNERGDNCLGGGVGSSA